ncbi:MAG: response regulator [Leptospiraceae bacterium]|nr:response regulator [Leptospiraceae bacterium]MDW7976938.1 response regulator [Leptospiraceae bacterium]
MKFYKVLIVDDIESIRVAIHDYLKSDYQVLTASNGFDALKILESQHIDIVISDIRMPDMDGITLIRKIQELYPFTKYSLITAYNINDYIKYAREYKIWNIIPKSSFLDLGFIKTMIYKLLSNDIFGFDKYFEPLQQKKIKLVELYRIAKERNANLEDRTVYHIHVHTEEERDKACEMIFLLLSKHQAPKSIRLILEELTLNARDYGSKQFQLPIKIQFGIFEKRLLLGVNDFSGKLNFQEVLRRLERNITYDLHGLPMSIHDERGRGIFIARENLDHLIFNIKENQETEVLGILDLESEFRNKTISMYKIKESSTPNIPDPKKQTLYDDIKTT